MSFVRLGIGAVAVVEMIVLAAILADEGEGSAWPPEIDLFVWELMAMAAAALVLAILPGRWTPVIAALLALAPIALAVFLFSLMSMLST
ncbi:hypothetical protein OZN62_05700 [Aurantiacibacter sp. MUD11]|uniref:hypothetical protein n=1 Tax=Aurantiacibacter sp. MUD11 TaxID=3003265 RepID=UPI0022AB071C|nr:hypothetical protein [Aurantiacibacter sp. MUD11]WAT19058.1 hypothetical protein OZN62_05700 [Aurantiacibacter sp. MUD11]